MQYSVVIPIFNEEKNIIPLVDEIKQVMERLGSYEIVLVDDGSKDGSVNILKKISKDNVKSILFRKNFGQSAAMDAGLKFASGEIIITMDGDRQNDPKDIPKLLKKLDEGYDGVSGWRWKRKDKLSKKIFSRFANSLRHFVINDHLHDAGCSLKVYKRECFEDFSLTGEMHRYIAEMLELKGFKIGEVKVNHRNRAAGKTKYSLSRVGKGFLDLFLVWFLQKYADRPLHLFGGIGLISGFVGVLSFLYVVYLKIFRNANLSSHFLSTLSVFLIIVGIQFFISGIIVDLLIKNQYKGKTRYSIKKILK